jgi:hypothetical protein
MFQLDRDIQGYVLLFSGLGGRNWPADICSGMLSIEEARETAGLVSKVTRRVRTMFYLRRDILDLSSLLPWLLSVPCEGLVVCLEEERELGECSPSTGTLKGRTAAS